MGHMFTGINKPADPSKPRNPFNFHAIFGKSVLYVVAILLIGFALFKIFTFGEQIVQNWQEIQFAYNKPTIVKAVMTQYQSKATDLDSQFVGDKPSQDAVLLNQIKSALVAPSK